LLNLVPQPPLRTLVRVLVVDPLDLSSSPVQAINVSDIVIARARREKVHKQRAALYSVGLYNVAGE